MKKVPATTQNALTADVLDVTGKVVESMTLPESVFGAKVNKSLIAQAVRVFLANQRAGSASTLTRGEVTGSTRKIYRQKGTGRARHGGVRAPIFVHGGVAHGPKPQDHSLKMPQKMKRAALLSTLALKAQNNQIKVITGLESIAPKTKSMVALLKSVKPATEKGRILVVMDAKHDSIVRATRNIEGVTYEISNQLHTYEVMHSATILFMKSAIETMAQTVQNKKQAGGKE